MLGLRTSTFRSNMIGVGACKSLKAPTRSSCCQSGTCSKQCRIARSKLSLLAPPRGQIISNAQATPQLGTVIEDEEKERARQQRRIVYNTELWKRHRSSLRYQKNVFGLLKSLLIRSLIRPILFNVAIATSFGLYITAYENHILPGFFKEAALNISEPLSLTSFALALLLVFRTNTSYSRWNEARCIWGKMLNRSRDIVRQSMVFIPDEQYQQQLMMSRWTTCFTKAMQWHLRQEGDLEELIKPHLREDEVKQLMAAQHKPLFVLNVLSEVIKRSNMQPQQEMQMMGNIEIFQDCLGGCERLLRTPIPLQYTRHTTRFVLVWLLCLPFALWGKLGWATVPVDALVSMLLLGIEEIAVQIEEPFGILPLEAIQERAEVDIYDTICGHRVIQQGVQQVIKGDRLDQSYIDDYQTSYNSLLTDSNFEDSTQFNKQDEDYVKAYEPGSHMRRDAYSSDNDMQNAAEYVLHHDDQDPSGRAINLNGKGLFSNRPKSEEPCEDMSRIKEAQSNQKTASYWSRDLEKDPW